MAGKASRFERGPRRVEPGEFERGPLVRAARAARTLGESAVDTARKRWGLDGRSDRWLSVKPVPVDELSDVLPNLQVARRDALLEDLHFATIDMPLSAGESRVVLGSTLTLICKSLRGRIPIAKTYDDEAGSSRLHLSFAVADKSAETAAMVNDFGVALLRFYDLPQTTQVITWVESRNELEVRLERSLERRTRRTK